MWVDWHDRSLFYLWRCYTTLHPLMITLKWLLFSTTTPFCPNVPKTRHFLMDVTSENPCNPRWLQCRRKRVHYREVMKCLSATRKIWMAKLCMTSCNYWTVNHSVIASNKSALFIYADITNHTFPLMEEVLILWPITLNTNTQVKAQKHQHQNELWVA